MYQVPVGNSKGKDEQCGHVGEVRREVSSTTTATSLPDEKTNTEKDKETLLELESREDKRSGTKEDAQARLNWANKLQFVLSCIGYSVGLGNLWRFPYLCYKSGGGAFLIPYFTMLFVCGIPLLLMELTVGQFTRRGPVGALAKLCPLLKGAGVGTVVMSFLVGTYYNIIMAWSIFYTIQSFTEDLPWKTCNATWADTCFDEYGANVTAPNDSKSATEEYFDKVVLQRSEGIEAMGSVRLELALALVAAWILVYFCIWKSIKSSGKVVYVTATVPYLLLGAFLWRALTLPGANNGLQYFFKPQWELLLDAQVWVNAAAQNFNSIGIAFGSLIAFASYNKLDNNIVLDTWAICLTNAFTSLLSGMIVFSTLGNIALEQGKDIDDVVAQGPGLVFTVYPQALAKMPYAAVWSVLFFFMLLIFGLDSQFANVEVIITSLQDEFPKWIKKHLKHHEFLVMIVCFVSFICGLPNVMEGGIYFFQLIDYYAASVSLMYVAFFEIIAVVWIYGAGRLAENLKEMTGKLPSLYFRCCWSFAAPVLIFAIWIFSLVDYKDPTYDNGKYKYPNWAIGTGWIIASLSILPTPILAVVEITRSKGSTLWEKIKSATRPKIEQCSCCARTHTCLNGSYFPREGVRDQMKLVACDYPLAENRGTVAPNQENGMNLTETYDRLV
ncbi:sodium- and chloride-dependent GABA transporter ine-like [Penaeus chinensis]|uniref:sodium- and chloride-dependent GABA transporter ine-like n=1 Tax=Penaeus chinensis TaxID=139456 RepID=UPI001FB6AF99|nr:sodium- and chloride-dependent GABA transporter ine-like [Penaeus chinensis]